MIRFHCPNCESVMEVDDAFAGRAARCATCGQPLRIPKPEDSVAAPLDLTEGEGPAGPTEVRIDGRTVEVMPPVSGMALGAAVLAGASVVVTAVVALATANRYAWIAGPALGALLALLAAMIGLPAYHGVRRSRGRKRGRRLAMVALVGGLGVFVGFASLATVVAIREFAFRPTCEENLTRIYAALQAYAKAHDGDLPRSLDTLAEEGFLDSRLWLTCPATSEARGRLTYTMVPRINLDDARFPPDMMLASDGIRSHGDALVRVLLKNGTIRKVPMAEWAEYEKAQGRLWGRIQGQIHDEAAEKDAAGGEGGAS